MSHPMTPQAIDEAKKGNWLLLQQIFGFSYVQELRKQAEEDAVLAYLAGS